MRCCNRKKEEQFEETEESGSESDTDFKIPFSVLSTEEKEIIMMYLWKKLIGRVKGAASLVAKLKGLREKQIIFG